MGKRLIRIGIIALLCFVILSYVKNAHAAVDSTLHFTAPVIGSTKKLAFPTAATASSKATVLVFLSAKCPCSAGHEATLKTLYEKFSPQGIEFIAVHANQDESAEMTDAHFKTAGLPFAVVQDTGAKIADELKALKTPHAYILKKGEVVFQGGVDDSADPTTAKKHFLEDALNSIVENKPIAVAKARALGCVIKR